MSSIENFPFRVFKKYYYVCTIIAIIWIRKSVNVPSLQTICTPEINEHQQNRTEWNVVHLKWLQDYKIFLEYFLHMARTNRLLYTSSASKFNALEQNQRKLKNQSHVCASVIYSQANICSIDENQFTLSTYFKGVFFACTISFNIRCTGIWLASTYYIKVHTLFK